MMIWKMIQKRLAILRDQKMNSPENPTDDETDEDVLPIHPIKYPDIFFQIDGKDEEKKEIRCLYCSQFVPENHVVEHWYNCCGVPKTSKRAIIDSLKTLGMYEERIVKNEK